MSWYDAAPFYGSAFGGNMGGTTTAKPTGQGNIYSDIFNPDVSNAAYENYYTTYPQAGYAAFLGNRGLSGFSDASQYGNNQYGRYYNQYLAALPGMNPGSNSFMSYLNENANPYNEFASLGARARGDAPSTYDPRTRYQMPG